jgi:hypothetical protein
MLCEEGWENEGLEKKRIEKGQDRRKGCTIGDWCAKRDGG